MEVVILIEKDEFDKGKGKIQVNYKFSDFVKKFTISGTNHDFAKTQVGPVKSTKETISYFTHLTDGKPGIFAYSDNFGVVCLGRWHQRKGISNIVAIFAITGNDSMEVALFSFPPITDSEEDKILTSIKARSAVKSMMSIIQQPSRDKVVEKLLQLRNKLAGGFF